MEEGACMRPSSRLFDGTARAWSNAEARSQWGGVEKVWTQVGDPFACAAQVERRNTGDLGPGEDEIGSWKVYSPSDAIAVQAGWVIEILTGPEAGRTLKVEDPYKPRGRFQQTRCRQWDNELPEEES